MDRKEARNKELERLRKEGKTPEIRPGSYEDQDYRVTRKVSAAPSVMEAHKIYKEHVGKFGGIHGTRWQVWWRVQHLPR